MGATDVEVWQGHRDRLFGLAYRMLGSVADAQDVVQDAYLRLRRADLAVIDELGAWLTTVTTRLCLDRLGSASARRETYVGPWLPEPLLLEPDVADQVALAESVSVAFLVVLESLSPLERVVFVLRDVFAFPYADIGAMLGRTPAACRQLASRARRHVEERRPRFEPDRAERERVADAFLEACAGADLAALLEVLDPGVVLMSDGGGVVAAARRPLHGPQRVAAFLLGLIANAGAEVTTRPVWVNGGRGAIVEVSGQIVAVLALDVAGGLVTGVNLVVNPQKLAAVPARRTPARAPHGSPASPP